MKRFILSIALAGSLTLFTNCNNVSDITNEKSLLPHTQSHLTFLGVEIDGSMTSFVEKMKAKGFTPIGGVIDNMIGMKGTFTNKPILLNIARTPGTRKVYRIGVFYKKNNSWYSLKSDYDKLKDAYKKRYIVEEEHRFFLDPYYEGDGYEMQALKLGKCDYSALFKTGFGSIILGIGESEQIIILYRDSINSALAEQEY